ncbi:MAG TPA: ABC transporter permease [Firmicutes bacterium]|nr:ABC transporter permease [Bacillota bacterium]
MITSIMVDGRVSFEHYIYLFKQAWLRKTFINSMKLAVTVATISTFIGYCYAYALNRTDIPCKGFFQQMSLLPIISPPFMFALSVILLLGKNGLITKKLLGLTSFNIYGFDGLVLVQSLSMFPIAYLVLDGVLKAISPDLEDSAFNLGATRRQVFRTVTMPLSLQGIASAWLLVFVTSLADFGNPVILGGDFDVLSVQAYLQVTGMFNTPRGAAIAFVLLAPALIAFYLQRNLSKKSVVTVTGKPSTSGLMKAHPLAKYILTILLSLISLMTLAFYGVIIYGCFVKLWGYNWSLTLENFAYAWDVGKLSIKATVIMAGIATVIAGLLSMVIAFLMVRKEFFGKKAMGFVTLLGYAIPGTLVGIGYILAFNTPPLLLTGTMWIIICCFVFREIPVGIESGVATLNQIDPAIEEASLNLGADTAYTFTHVTLPLIKPAFFASLAYSFVRSMTAVSAVIFLVTARWNHLTALVLAQTEIMRLGPASVLSFFTIIIVFIVFALIRLSLGQISYTAPRIGG